MRSGLKIIIALLLIICLSHVSYRSASAIENDGRLYIYPLPQYSVGDQIYFRLSLRSVQDNPLSLQPIDLFLNGALIQSVETDANGSAIVRLQNPLDAGTYHVEAIYIGYQFNVPPTSLDFEVVPIEVVIQSVPVIAGLELSFDGNIVKTGEDGIVRIPVHKVGIYNLELLPNEELLTSQNAIFVQWFPPSFSYQNQVNIPGTKLLEVGFEKQYSAIFNFTDMLGNPIPEDRIEEIILRASNGDVIRLSQFGVNKLDVNRIFARLSGLDSSNVVYRFHSVMVDGSNVVNQGQQRFLYSPEQEIRVELLMFSIHVTAEDLLLRIPTGKGITLHYPNNEVKYFPFEVGGGVNISGLARGNYSITVDSDDGFKIDVPLVITRDQDVRVPVLSYFDVIFSVWLAIGFLIGIPLWGHRRKVISLFMRKHDRGLEG